MAIKRLVIDGYGQLELNQVAFRRDGRIEAQCALSETVFSKEVPAENGMLLTVDNAKREVRFCADGDTLIALHYSSEHQYDEREQGLKFFKLEPKGFLPRLGYLAIGDKFTTNCVCYNTEDYADERAMIVALDALTSIPMYAKPGANGAILLSKDLPTTGLILQATKKTTMPDGQLAIKFQVLKV